MEWNNLIVSATGCKHGKRAGKHGAPRKCQSRCNAYHVLLGNTHVNHALWEGLLEVGKLGGASKVCVNSNDALLASQKGLERLMDALRAFDHEDSF